MLTLALGFLIGILCNYSFIFLEREPFIQITGALPSQAPSGGTIPPGDPAAPPNQTEAARAAIMNASLDPSSNTPLLRRACDVLEALKSEDYPALSRLIHPERGVAFTPYSTVEPDSDLCFRPDQIAKLAENKETYVWGKQAGLGAPIDLTMADYFAKYVFSADYTQAPEVGVDTVLKAGNALENVFDAYPAARFVDFHFPGLDPKSEGYDWCSLKLVFEARESEWMLVGIIHSQWTT